MKNEIKVEPLPPHFSQDQIDQRAGVKSPQIDWQKPEPIGQAELPRFPVDALPPVLANWVEEESEATQTPADVAALLALAVCASTLAKRVTVQAWDGWCEPCNLYVAAILEPGNRKSAVFKHATEPLREVEKQLQEDSAESVAARLSDHRQAERRLAKLEKIAAENADGNKRDEAKQEARELAKKLAKWPKPEEPTLIVDDATSEKLAILMQSNGERLASMSAEGGVFDLMAGKYSGSATDINVYLMGHSGDTVVTHRVSRSPVKLSSPALTMALTIQSEVIRGIAAKNTFRGRGLLGRFLYAMPKSWIGHRKIAPPPVSSVATLAYSHVIESLSRLEPTKDGSPHRIKLSDDAVGSFTTFCKSIETELGSGALESMKDWGGKLAGATLRISAILHCVAHGGETGLSHDIDTATMEAAQRIAWWAIPHAASAMDLLAASDDEARDDGEYLLRWLKNDRPTEPTFDRRDAQRHGHRRFNRQPVRLDAALRLLESTGHIANLNVPKIGGKVSYAVSPFINGDQPDPKTPGRASQNTGDYGNNTIPNQVPDLSMSASSPAWRSPSQRRETVTI